MYTGVGSTLPVPAPQPTDPGAGSVGQTEIPSTDVEIPPAEAKPINPTRLAKFDKEFGRCVFELTSPSGVKCQLTSEAFSRRYLPSVNLGDCRDRAVHDLKSPGNPMWKFQCLG
jgi:hypothetical protein